MLQEKLLSKVLKATSAIALSGTLMSSFLTPTWAMDDEEKIIQASSLATRPSDENGGPLPQDIKTRILLLCPFQELIYTSKIWLVSHADAKWFREHLGPTEVSLELPRGNLVYRFSSEQKNAENSSSPAKFKFTYRTKSYTYHKQEKLDVISYLSVPFTLSGLMADVDLKVVSQLSELMKNNTNLTNFTLKYDYNHYTRTPISNNHDPAIDSFFCAFTVSKSEVLDTCVSKLLHGNTSLTSLDLKDVNDDFPIGRMLQSEIPSLKTLHLRELFPNAPKIIEKYTSLHNLILNDYTPNSLKSLLSQASFLQHLTMPAYFTSSSGNTTEIQELKEAFKGNKLMSLKLRPSFSNNDLSVISSLIGESVTPPYLDLTENFVNLDKTLAHWYDDLGADLMKNTSLTRLDFQKHANHRLPNLHSLFDSLKTKTNLKILNIFNIKNDEKADLEAKGLADWVKLHPSQN